MVSHERPEIAASSQLLLPLSRTIRLISSIPGSYQLLPRAIAMLHGGRLHLKREHGYRCDARSLANFCPFSTDKWRLRRQAGQLVFVTHDDSKQVDCESFAVERPTGDPRHLQSASYLQS